MLFMSGSWIGPSTCTFSVVVALSGSRRKGGEEGGDSAILSILDVLVGCFEAKELGEGKESAAGRGSDSHIREQIVHVGALHLARE